MKRQINQRDIYYCDFGDNDGSEQSGERPSLIISNDLGNVNSDTIIVLPITSKKKKDLPIHYILYKDIYPFFKDEENTVLTEQIRCVSKKKLHKKMGQISVEDFNNVKVLSFFAASIMFAASASLPTL